MHLTSHQRVIRAVVAGVLMVGMVMSSSAPASAAPPISVDFTVFEPLSSEGGPTVGVVVDSDDFLNCLNGSVVTSMTTVTQTGPLTKFQGSKIVDCGGNNTLSLTFRAKASPCSSTDSGTWKITGGTGGFAGAKGHGGLVGTYKLDDGLGTSCDNSGIADRYTGKIKLAS